MRSGRERESTREEAQRESGGDWGRVSGVGYAVVIFTIQSLCRGPVYWMGPNRFMGDVPVVVKKVLLITVV
jgi:hypothetical protein